MKPNRSSFDPAYIRWQEKFALFKARCFEALCEFVRVHFDEFLERYYRESHVSLQHFPAWAFERYLQSSERKKALCGSWERKDEEWRTPI